MDVTFVRESGESFSIEVGFFNSFREVKEKVQKYQGIPVSKQSLFFNGQHLQDDGVIINSDLCQDSRIQLQVAPVTTIELKVKIAGHKSSAFPLQMELDDTVLLLKEKIHDKWNSLQVNAMALRLSTATGDRLLLDHQSLRECGASNDSTVYVLLLVEQQQPEVTDTPPAPAAASGGGDGRKTLKVMVLPRKVTEKIPLEVNPCVKVEDLRKELNKFFGSLLPEDRLYFFIHKQSLMTENESLQWHNVKDGDTIEIFHGYVTDHTQQEQQPR